ncbi:hypothetical protein B0J18DRAFT_224359 [Chaetomium sp. MPI-SDFR-AT-0129]|nr:hypothetical protein B0J18DRAFT_224359 [Chaetomium sp. MPI-SDFR-AT-0129]
MQQDAVPLSLDTANAILLLVGGRKRCEEVRMDIRLLYVLGATNWPTSRRSIRSGCRVGSSVSTYLVVCRCRPSCFSLLLIPRRKKLNRDEEMKQILESTRVRGTPQQQQTNTHYRPISSSTSPQRPLFCRVPHDGSHKPGTIPSSQPSKCTVALVFSCHCPRTQTHPHVYILYCTPTLLILTNPLTDIDGKCRTHYTRREQSRITQHTHFPAGTYSA